MDRFEISKISGLLSKYTSSIVMDLVDTMCFGNPRIFGLFGLCVQNSPKTQRLNFPPKRHFWTSPTNSDCNAGLRRAAACVRLGARKRSRVIRCLANPENFGDHQNRVDHNGSYPPWWSKCYYRAQSPQMRAKNMKCNIEGPVEAVQSMKMREPSTGQ